MKCPASNLLKYNVGQMACSFGDNSYVKEHNLLS